MHQDSHGRCLQPLSTRARVLSRLVMLLLTSHVTFVTEKSYEIVVWSFFSSKSSSFHYHSHSFRHGDSDESCWIYSRGWVHVFVIGDVMMDVTKMILASICSWIVVVVFLDRIKALNPIRLLFLPPKEIAIDPTTLLKHSCIPVLS